MTDVTDRRGARFAWREAGGGAETPLLLLHGLGGSRLSWEPQLAALSSARRVLAWELPGYGDSAPLDGPLTFEALADAVVAFAAEAADASRFHLAGISFGGMIAQHTAIRHPSHVASLTLLASSPCFGLHGTSPDAWRAARLAPLDAGQEPADFAERVLSGIAGPFISEDAFAGQVAAMARVPGSALREAVDCVIAHDTRALLPTVDAPTLCLVGALDEETPPAYSELLVGLVPGARLVVVDGAGHLLNVEAADRVNALIAEHVVAKAPTR